jgi:peptidyl-prolyl cis-trans isomerase D
MPSREFRRATRRAQQQGQTTADRKREGHPVIYGLTVLLLVVIVVTFIGLPVASRLGPGGRIVFGYYRGKPIEYYPGNYLSERKDIIADQLRQSGQTGDMETQVYQVWRTAFDQTVLHTAILYEAEKSGLSVSGNLIDEALIKSGPYQVDGQFSEQRYRDTPSAERYATRKLFQQQLIHDQYLRDVLGAQRLSDGEQEFLAAMVDQQRRFTFVTFSFESYPEDKVKAYAQEKEQLFRRIKLSDILIKSSEQEAQQIRNKIVDRTSSFEELARTYSKDAYADKGGDMGFRYFYDLEADYDTTAPVEQIFALKEGELSPVMKSRFGWVIYRADSAAVAPDLANAETLQVVRDYVMKYEKGMVEDYTLAQAKAFRQRVTDVGFLGATLEGMYTVGVTDYFPLNYQSFYVLAPVRSALEQFNLSTAAYSQDFFKQAFSLAPGAVSEPILLDDQVLVLRLDDARKPPQQELEVMNEYFTYLSQQSLEQDLQTALLNPAYIKDEFNQTFTKHIYGGSSTSASP